MTEESFTFEESGLLLLALGALRSKRKDEGDPSDATAIDELDSKLWRIRRNSHTKRAAR